MSFVLLNKYYLFVSAAFTMKLVLGVLLVSNIIVSLTKNINMYIVKGLTIVVINPQMHAAYNSPFYFIFQHHNGWSRNVITLQNREVLH